MFRHSDILIECVPNFSEGRNKAIIEAIAEEIRQTPSVQLLHIDIGFDANRTVYTYIGKPEAIVEATYKAIKKAYKLIDMRLHAGKHPRMGACDVCPLIPYQNIDMETTKTYVEKLGKQLGDLGLPVYLYENSATTEARKNLASIRKGEYEAIADKIMQKEWDPDFGPTVFNQKFGMIALGARAFLLAYNINLDTKDLSIGKKIAKAIRDKRDNEKYPQLQYCRAIAWYIEEYGFVQISTNITNYNASPIFYIFGTVKEIANDFGIRVNGSELIGLIPQKALLVQNPSNKISDQAKIEDAIEYLGLNQVFSFQKEKRIIDYILELK